MNKKLQKTLCLLLCAACLLSISGCKQPEETDDGCVDGQCTIPQLDSTGASVYSVVSPVGYHDVDMIQQAPRLDTLDGKTIALVGGSFMASTTHAQLRKCLQEAYPTAKIYYMQEVGSGGPYSVFGQSAQTKAFQARLQELEVDAVISGNCGCGLCTTKEAGSSIAAEYIGIPTVTVGAPSFIAQIHSTGVNRGVPVLRTAQYPGAFASHSTRELEENTKAVVFDQVVKGLTEPITESEIALYANDGKRPYDEIIYYGNFEEIQEFFQVNGWTDGLPVVPPTDEKIQQYLRFTSYKASDILGTYALAYRECSVYTVAANAVMAGVPEEYMPVCIAFVQCMENGEWRRPLASTHGWSSYAWLNGPVARQLGIDCAQGMISEENNKALGRFIDLAMLNIGGYYVKENRMGTFGYLSAWTFSEDEQACAAVGWTPYHVTQGYDWNDNTITAASALQWGNNVTPATDDPEQIMQLLAWDITEKQQNGLGNTSPQVYRTVFITEYVARDLAKTYKSKQALEDALIEAARRPLFLRAYANYWANTGSQQYEKYTFEEYYNKLLNDPAEQAAMTDTPAWLEGIVKEEKLETIATMLPGQTPILLTGDTDRNKFQVMPGGGYVTVKIKLPNDWNDLVAPLGYEPLESFYIEAKEPASQPQQPAQTAPQTPVTIEIPNSLTDGTYRLVPSEAQMTEQGRVLCADGQLQYWAYGAAQAQTLTLHADGFSKLVNGLGFNCSFTVQGGQLSAVVLRPSTVSRKTATDVSVLTAQLLGDTPVTFAINTKQSKQAGAVTPKGTTVTVSATLTQIKLDLGGQAQLSKEGAEGFAAYENGILTLDPNAQAGAYAQIGIRMTDGTGSLRIVKKTADTLVFAYQ